MSNIYIQEPPTIGKVLLKTSVGDIDVELWSKETPKACRNFVQLCMEGYYDGTIFHRVVPDFIVQGGDPTGTGEGGESIYGAPFKDEFHTRLRFNRRGLVAMANAGPNDNGSQFFFTMGAAPELQGKHTIFGKVVGDTIYNMIKLQECEVDSNERPLFPHKIIKAQILSNPYDDIVPRAIKRKSKSDEEKKPKSKSKATKNFKLLSFGEEAEEEEHAIDKASESMRGKSKSSHDLTNDPKLSSVPAVDMEAQKPRPAAAEKEGKRARSDSEEDGEELDEISQEELEKVRDKLKKKIKREEKMTKSEDNGIKEEDEKKKRRDEPREEAKNTQKESTDAKKKVSKQTNDPPALSQAEEKSKKKESESEALAEFRQERQKYKERRRQQQPKGQGREAMTMALLSKFQEKLSAVRKATVDYSDDEEEEEGKKEEEEEEDDPTDLSWMNHTLKFDDQKRKVLDANINDADRYEIFDPRNPITKRRRENSKKAMKEKK